MPSDTSGLITHDSVRFTSCVSHYSRVGEDAFTVDYGIHFGRVTPVVWVVIWFSDPCTMVRLFASPSLPFDCSCV